MSLFGTWLTDTMSKTSPMGSVIRAFDLQSGYQICRGGSFNLARGLMETFIAAGGSYLPQARIDRIVIEGGRATGIALDDGRTVRASAIRRQHHRRASDLREPDRPRAAAGTLRSKLDEFQYTAWTLFGLHLALHESPRFAAAAFDPNIDRALKWSIGADTMEDLFAAHRDVQAGRVPSLVQFGSGPLSLLDPTQAPPGKHTTYAWHVMPLDPDTGGKDYETSSGILRQDPRDLGALLPEHDGGEHHRPISPIPRANTSRNSPTCATATFSWARSTPSR